MNPEFGCADTGPAKVAPGFSPANAGPGRPEGLRHSVHRIAANPRNRNVFP